MESEQGHIIKHARVRMCACTHRHTHAHTHTMWLEGCSVNAQCQHINQGLPSHWQCLCHLHTCTAHIHTCKHAFCNPLVPVQILSSPAIRQTHKLTSLPCYASASRHSPWMNVYVHSEREESYLAHFQQHLMQAVWDHLQFTRTTVSSL